MSAFLIDSNLWVAATLLHHPSHALARSFLSGASAERPAAFCRATQLSFLRLVTTSALQKAYLTEAFSNQDALSALRIFQALPHVIDLPEPPGITQVWFRLAARPTASPKVWMDAYLAALAICGQHEFVTLDRDFEKFEGEGLKLQVLQSPAN